MQSEILAAKDDEEEYKTILLQLEDPLYFEKYIREHLLYSKPGELIIRGADEEDE